MSSAAVADDGHVYVISTRKIEGRFTSTLHKLTPEGAFVWESRLGDFGYTTGSPKVWRSNVFVHVRQSSVNFRHEVFVFDQAGTAVSREFAQLCEPEVVGTSDVVDWLSAFWDFLTDCLFGCYVRPSPDPLFQQFGWLDPTVAVIDFPGLEPSGQPLIVVVDNCGLIAFRWNTVNLTRVWAQESSYFDYSSPAVSGPLTIGRRDGRVVAYDYLTGVKLWEYDAGDTVMATPASIGRQIYAVSYEHLHVLDANGALVGKTALPGKTPFPLAAAPSASVASPALSANLVYVSSTGGLLAAAFDLSSYAAVTSIEGGLSSPAIAPDGTVYVVTRGGSLLAYPAP